MTGAYETGQALALNKIAAHQWDRLMERLVQSGDYTQTEASNLHSRLSRWVDDLNRQQPGVVTKLPGKIAIPLRGGYHYIVRKDPKTRRYGQGTRHVTYLAPQHEMGGVGTEGGKAVILRPESIPGVELQGKGPSRNWLKATGQALPKKAPKPLGKDVPRYYQEQFGVGKKRLSRVSEAIRGGAMSEDPSRLGPSLREPHTTKAPEIGGKPKSMVEVSRMSKGRTRKLVRQLGRRISLGKLKF